MKLSFETQRRLRRFTVPNLMNYIVGGMALWGIAHAAITATILDLPMGYVRSGSKDHGRGNRIEGKLEQGPADLRRQSSAAGRK